MVGFLLLGNWALNSTYQIHFFLYLQVRHYVKENLPGFESSPTIHPFLDNFKLCPDSKQLISKFVHCFTASVSSDHIRETWAHDLNSEISVGFWEEAMSRVHSCSINSCYRLIQYKVMHRLHYSKTKLNRIFPSVSPECDKCLSAEGSLAHLLWFCPTLHNYWTTIFEWLSKAYSRDIQPNHDLAVFGCSTRTFELSYDIQTALHLAMAVAKKTYTPDLEIYQLLLLYTLAQRDVVCYSVGKTTSG